MKAENYFFPSQFLILSVILYDCTALTSSKRRSYELRLGVIFLDITFFVVCFSKSIPQENLNPIKTKISKNSIIISLGKIQLRIVTVFFWGLYRSCLTYYVNLLIICVTLTEKTTSTCLFTNIWEIDWLIFYFVDYLSKLSFVMCFLVRRYFFGTIELCLSK